MLGVPDLAVASVRFMASIKRVRDDLHCGSIN
jgi:hypothetical protein